MSDDADSSENGLVQAAKAGDFAAFEELVNRHERRLYALAMRILRHSHDAEDVLQTSFVSAIEKLGGFREQASFKTWITRIVTNNALKVLRRRRGHGEVSLDAATEPDAEGRIPHPEYIADWAADPTAELERGELRKVLDEAIAALPEHHRLVFVLRDLEELSTRDTAEALDISEANVKVRLLRARLALRERLTRVFGDPDRRVPGHDRGSTSAAELLASYRKEPAI